MCHHIIMVPNLYTIIEVQELLAKRLRTLRLQSKYKQSTLASRAGVSVGSLKRFESTGEISLKNLLRLSQVLGRMSEFVNLLTSSQASSLSELEAQVTKPVPKRGSR